MTTTSRPKSGSRLVRISARLVEILLNSCSVWEFVIWRDRQLGRQVCRGRKWYGLEIRGRELNYNSEVTTNSSAPVFDCDPASSWRYSLGLTPQTLRKTCAKCCWVLNPQATATSKTRASATRNIALARTNRWRNTN